jgi:hypothetical protein
MPASTGEPRETLAEDGMIWRPQLGQFHGRPIDVELELILHVEDLVEPRSELRHEEQALTACAAD